MTSVREKHERAMQFADEMVGARARRDREGADRFARLAFQEELGAAKLAFRRKVSVATRLILLRSAANLAREAKEWRPGLDLAVEALNVADLLDHRSELFHIIDTLRTYEHLQ